MPLRNQSHIITSSLGNVILFVFIFLVYLSAPLFPAMAQNIEHTQNTADASLRGGLQVDPSTLGMTVQIPLGEYSGRGGLNIPITLSYGSKLWRMQTLIGFEAFLGYQTQSAAMFAEHSMSGWTSSLDPPEIEFARRLDI